MDRAYRTVSGGGGKMLDDMAKIYKNGVADDMIRAKLKAAQKDKAELEAAQANFKRAKEKQYKAETKVGLHDSAEGTIDPRANAAVENMFANVQGAAPPDSAALDVAKNFNQNAARTAEQIRTAGQMAEVGLDPDLGNVDKKVQDVENKLLKKPSLEQVADQVKTEAKLPPLPEVSDEDAVKKMSPAQEDRAEPGNGNGLMKAVEKEEEKLMPN